MATTSRPTRLLSSLATAGALLAACTVTEIGGTGGGSKAEGATTSAKEGAACASAQGKKLKETDPATLPKCACEKGGEARCLSKEGLPADLLSQLASCNGGGGACIPDDLLRSGGRPKTCKSTMGEGRCMSVCLPQVAENADLLSRGEGNACGSGERCVPCNDPRQGGRATGVCEIERAVEAECDGGASSGSSPAPATAPLACPYVGPPLVDVTTLPSCGDGARCVDRKHIPEAAAAQLAPCPTGLCAPEKVIAAGGQFVPETCRSIKNGEGRCASVALPAVSAQKDFLTRDACDANERCIPCFSPGDGKPTGACSTVSCDKPKEPPVAFEACCDKGGVKRGKCLPKASIPADKQGQFDDRDCREKDTLCVPSALLTAGHVFTKCTASGAVLGNYRGVCHSDCLDFGLGGIVINQGTCPTFERCVPCERNGQPTGAPGCGQK